jgi:hypothetical protein
MLYLTILLMFVFFAGIAMTVNEGLWSNAISLLCVVLSALIAWAWGPILGAYVVEQAKPNAANEWAFWFASIWGVFFFAVMLMRIIADRSSRVRMRFVRPLDMAGGIVLGLGVATMFTSFTAYSLYLPFKASVWKVKEGAAWQQQTIQSLAGPMYATGKAVLGDDFPSLNK